MMTDQPAEHSAGLAAAIVMARAGLLAALLDDLRKRWLAEGLAWPDDGLQVLKALRMLSEVPRGTSESPARDHPEQASREHNTEPAHRQSMMTAGLIASAAGVDVSLVRRSLRRGLIPGRKDEEGQWQAHETAVEDWLRKRRARRAASRSVATPETAA